MNRSLRPALTAAALLAGLSLTLAAPGDARETVLYETAAGHRALTGAQPGGGPGLGAADGAFQQQPAVRLIGAERQVAKVSGRGGSPSSPTLIGRGAAGMADLLRARIIASGAKRVFIDELSGEFRGPEGDALGAAMTALATEPAPDGVGTMADRVHIYIPGPATLVAQADRYAGSWTALTLAGGVWIETYRGARAWSDEEWAAWPGLFAEAFAARSGASERLHLVLTKGDQARQWERARTGAACAMLANGPGAYRVAAPDAPAFVAEFRRTFGPGPAPAGPSAITCAAPTTIPPAPAAALAGAAATPSFTAAEWGLPRLWRGLRSQGEINLGTDPLGLAATLGVDPATFWAGAGAALVGTGESTLTRAPVRADGRARVSVVPGAAGPVAFRLIVPGAAIREALDVGPADLAASLEAAGAPAEFIRSMRISPRTWRLDIPVTAPAESGWTGIAEEPPTPAGGPAEAKLLRAGIGRVRADGRDPRRWSLIVLRMTAADGRPVPAARAIVRRPWMKPIVQKTAPDGLLSIWVPRRSGELRVTVPAWSIEARRPITGRPPGNIRLAIGVAGRRAVGAAGRDPRRWAMIVVRARAPRGTAGGVPLVIRGTTGGVIRRRTGADARARVFVRRTAGGIVRARVVGQRRETRRRL